MITKLNAAAVLGLDPTLIEVEVDLNRRALPSFVIVGLGDTAVQEARERVRSALKNSQLQFPRGKITVNLAPADLKKQGPAFDLPIALGIAAAAGDLVFSPEIFQKNLFIGELSLEGKLRPINGVLPVALLAAELGFTGIFVPVANADEAALVPELQVYPVPDLATAVAHCTGQQEISPRQPLTPHQLAKNSNSELDMAFVKGQEHAKRALEIAAAGAHNILMNGPPGSGKTLLARTFPTILPAMDFVEMLEATKIYSVAGLLPAHTPLIAQRPFRSPHHTSSGVALVGGGKFPKPGEISLAHRGVLFLDEFAEFPAQVLENLRQPLEDGIVTVSRATGSCTFPAKFTLVAAMNPCPCGHATDPEKECTCSPTQIVRYQKKISGPLLDRIDLLVEIPRLDFDKISASASGETSATIRARVQAARNRQAARFSDTKILTNADMRPQDIDRFCALGADAKNLLRQATRQMQLSGRAVHRILKIARTIADLDNHENLALEHIAEALQYRQRVVGQI